MPPDHQPTVRKRLTPPTNSGGISSDQSSAATVRGSPVTSLNSTSRKTGPRIKLPGARRKGSRAAGAARTALIVLRQASNNATPTPNPAKRFATLVSGSADTPDAVMNPRTDELRFTSAEDCSASRMPRTTTTSSSLCSVSFLRHSAFQLETIANESLLPAILARNFALRHNLPLLIQRTRSHLSTLIASHILDHRITSSPKIANRQGNGRTGFIFLLLFR